MNYRQSINHMKQKLDHAVRTAEDETLRVKEEMEDVDIKQKALETTQVVAQAVEQAVHERVAKVVSSCLSAVFDDPYEFRITFERKRGKTEASLTLIRNGLEVDPMLAAGGGVVDVAAFALRVSCLSLQKDKLRQVLILDEPCKFLSEDLQPRLKPLFEELSRSMGVQFVIVTHMRSLKVGRVIEL